MQRYELYETKITKSVHVIFSSSLTMFYFLVSRAFVKTYINHVSFVSQQGQFNHTQSPLWKSFSFSFRQCGFHRELGVGKRFWNFISSPSWLRVVQMGWDLIFFHLEHILIRVCFLVLGPRHLCTSTWGGKGNSRASWVLHVLSIPIFAWRYYFLGCVVTWIVLTCLLFYTCWCLSLCHIVGFLHELETFLYAEFYGNLLTWFWTFKSDYGIIY